MKRLARGERSTWLTANAQVSDHAQWVVNADMGAYLEAGTLGLGGAYVSCAK